MMLLEKLISEQFTLNGNSRYARANEHDSLVLDRKKRIFFWNSRNLAGDAYTWLTKILGYSDSDAKTLIENEKEAFVNFTSDFTDESEPDPVPYPILVDVFYEKGQTHLDYWQNVRGYTDRTISEFKLGYTGYWYTIPIYIDGEFKNFQLRRVATANDPRKSGYWYKDGGKHPFNFSILKLTDWAVLTEGPVDAIMLRQYGIPAVSQTSGSGYWNQNWNKYFAHLDRIWVVYDNDKAGRIHATERAETWGMRAKIYTFPDFSEGYDITDFFKEYKTHPNPRELFLASMDERSKYYFEMEEWHGDL